MCSKQNFVISLVSSLIEFNILHEDKTEFNMLTLREVNEAGHRITDIEINTDISNDLKLAKVSAKLNTNKNLILTYTLTDKDGMSVAEGEANVNDGDKITIADVKEPSLWSDEAPYLYYLSLEYGEEVIRLPIGLRKIEVKGRVVYINGKAVKLKGFNRPDSNPVTGHAVTMEDMLRDR